MKIATQLLFLKIIMVKRIELEHFLNQTLKAREYPDYGPNGLQIEGVEEIEKIAFAVSATRDSIEKTLAMKAQALIVHHGLFWSFHGVRPITGTFAKRVAPLVSQQVNLFGYHLPLDAHPEVGNAACLAQRLGLINQAPFGDYKGYPTGVKGEFSAPIKAADLKEKLQTILNHSVLHSAPSSQEIRTLGIITGGANSGWQEAAKQGLDAYLTGEMSEHDWHEAQEAQVHMFAGGHHATEQFGIQALEQLIKKNFSVQTQYIDSGNPA